MVFLSLTDLLCESFLKVVNNIEVDKVVGLSCMTVVTWVSCIISTSDIK